MIVLSLLSLNINFETEASRKVFYPIGMENEYAILFSSGYNTNNNHARYWNDIGEAYLMLKKYGYREENIIVLYADGNSPNVTNCHNWTEVKPQYSIMGVDYPATKGGLRSAVSSIPHTKNNSLFMFTTDHGASNGSLVLWMEELSPNEFAEIFSPTLIYRVRIFEFEQCFSGAFVAPLSSGNTIVVTAATDDEYSWAMQPEYEYDSFNFFFNAAIKEELPEVYFYEVPPSKADANMDGRVSMAEAFNYAANLANFEMYSTPWYNDDGTGIPKTSTHRIMGSGSLGDLTHLGVLTILRPTTVYQATGNENINPSKYAPLYNKGLDELALKLETLRERIEVVSDYNQKTELENIYQKAIELMNAAEEEAKKERYLQAKNIIQKALFLISNAY